MIESAGTHSSSNTAWWMTVLLSDVYTMWIFPSVVCTADGYAYDCFGSAAMLRWNGHLLSPSFERAATSGVRELMLSLKMSSRFPLFSFKVDGGVRISEFRVNTFAPEFAAILRLGAHGPAVGHLSIATAAAEV